ncbi:MAG: glycosyltransferase family 9 protein [Verrucomicrobia bacterium]|nr:glycosyltransferase family 9 protein [Verrucomicrobiota bacterium]
MRKILVLRGGALGDFIVTLPALSLLRTRWPQAEVHLVGNATAATLAFHRGLLTAVHSQHEGRWAALHGEGPLPPEFAAWLTDFDLILNFWPDPAGDLGRRFPLRPDQAYLVAAALPEISPAAAHYCAPLARFGIKASDLVYPLRPLAGRPVGERQGITVHPGSGSARKNWPPSRWLELLRSLPPPVDLILGEVEADAWSDPDLPGVRRLVCQPLETLVDHLSTTRLFLGHDSGISHLAVACGAPSLLLFGPTDPAMWAPPSPACRVIRVGPDLAAISLAHVQAVVREQLREST